MANKEDFENLSKKEKKDYLKDLRQSQEKKGALKSNIIKLVVVGAILLVVGGVIYLFATDKGGPSLLGDFVTEQSRQHITDGSTQHPPYNSNPPTSGPHWPTPQICDIYDKPVPDEAAIHSMEHGAVWISYKDAADKGLSESLKKIVEKNPGKVILSPRPQNDSKIALVSWTRLLKLESFDESKVTEFIKSNRNNSPEPLASCGPS